MDKIYYKLLRFGCIEKDEYKEMQALADGTSELRADFLNELESKNSDMKTSFKELYEEEVQLIAKIKQLINTGEFKRAYKSSQNQGLINEYLELLEDNRIECTKGLEDLKRIVEYTKNLIVHQKQIDKTNLNNIKKQVGSKIWTDFHEHFKSEEFLTLVSARTG